MRARVFCFLILFLFAAASVACSKGTRITVVFPGDEGLKPGAGVYLKGKRIGEVKSVSVDKDGDHRVKVEMEHGFSKEVTDRCRFIAGEDPQRPKEPSIEVVCLEEGGKPLANGAIVQGSSRFAILMERSQKELEALSKRWREQLDRLQKEIKGIPEKEWYKDLERQMDLWAKELSRSGNKAKRYFETEILPQLEKSLKELEKRLKEEGKEKEAEPLKKKLEGLKEI